MSTIIGITPLWDLEKESLWMLSAYTDAIRQSGGLAPGMEAMATAPDGIIEAFHSTLHRFLWAVQWHPEYLYATDPDSQKLFARFIQECYHETE